MLARGVQASTERHGTHPWPAAVLEKKRRMLKAHPRVSGLQKLRTTKLNTKGRIQRASVRASHPLSSARPWRSPRRAVGFISLPPFLAPDRPWGDPGGSCPPRSALPCSCIGGLPRLLLTPCSKCWLGSGEASPGQCRRGARSPRSPSRSAGSSCSL